MSADKVPFTFMKPFVGFMIPLKSLSIVLFPAPFEPMIPNASPFFT